MESVWPDWLEQPAGVGALVASGLDAACAPIEQAVASIGVDPLARLLDPEFTETLWEYEHSRTEPMIPGQMHPKQRAVFMEKARHFWLFWGNQVGKTTIGAVTVVAACLGRHPVLNQLWQPPLTCWASALSWELWENILLPELLTWIPKDRLIDAPEPYKHSTKRHILIRADNGKISRITGKAAEQGPGKYQSARVHIFWPDEEHPEAVWDEAQPRLLRHGGVTIATMTPLKGLSWVYHRIYEPWKQGKTMKGEHFVSHAGLVDNPSIRPEDVEALKRELKHNPSQLEARLYGHFVRPMGLVLPFAAKHFETVDDRSRAAMLEKATIFCGVDFGLWRFALVVFVVDRAGRVHLIDEMFSQREDLDTRAQKLHDLLSRLNAPRTTMIAGDCANPQDIVEINRCLGRIESPYRVTAVKAENKIRRVGVERIENLMNRGSFLVRRGIGEGQVWYLGMNASKQGKPVEGSRWVWEVNNWLYPKAEDGKIQKDDPDDASADGADMMAATRYAIMTWWTAAALPEEKPVDPWDPKVIRAEEEWRKYDRPPPVAATRYGRRVGGSNPMNGV